MAAATPSLPDLTSSLLELLHRVGVQDVITKMILYIDLCNWQGLISEVLAVDSVTIDNGDGPQAVTPSALVAAWKLNAEGVDTMYHQISAPIVSFQSGKRAHGVAYGSVFHSRRIATQGQSRTMVGLYEWDLDLLDGLGWRIAALKFSLAHVQGNALLK